MKTAAEKIEKEYQIAFVNSCSGEFEVVQVFTADGGDAANDFAEKAHPGGEWYVLDAMGRNINGGEEE